MTLPELYLWGFVGCLAGALGGHVLTIGWRLRGPLALFYLVQSVLWFVTMPLALFGRWPPNIKR